MRILSNLRLSSFEFDFLQSKCRRAHMPIYRTAILWGIVLTGITFLAGITGVEAAAPQRTAAWATSKGLNTGDQPYAEATLCATGAVILCEDFNYPQDITYDGVGQHNCCHFYNPGVAVDAYGFKQWASLFIKPLTDYSTNKTGGSMPSGSQPDNVWVGNWDASKGPQGGGNLWATVRQPGQNYLSGHTPAQARDIYYRFQIYFTPNFQWPGDPKLDTYNYSGKVQCYDTKILYIYPPGSEYNPTGAHYDAGAHTQCGVYDATTNTRFADALAFRYGNVSGNYKFFPLCANCAPYNNYQNYGPFQSLTLRNPHDQPLFKRAFRFDTGKWYTLEFRYRISSTDNVADGAIEAWIDGTKIYSELNLETCGSGSVGKCDPLGELYLGAYHNGNDGPPSNNPWNGQMVIDNLVISTAYIGPPGGQGGGGDTTPPATPTGLRLLP